MTTETKPRILLVEDDNFLAGMYVTKLEMENFETSLAGDGKEGLEKAIAEKPDAILLDVLLPKMSGFEVLKELKKNPETSDIPVIMLTNLGQKSDINKGLDLGAADYLIKAHLLPSEVIAKVKEIIAHHRTAKPSA